MSRCFSENLGTFQKVSGFFRQSQQTEKKLQSTQKSMERAMLGIRLRDKIYLKRIKRKSDSTKIS